MNDDIKEMGLCGRVLWSECDSSVEWIYVVNKPG